MQNPILQNNINKKIYLFTWSGIMLLHFVVLYFFYHQPLHFSIIDSLLFNGFFAFIGISLWYFVRFYENNRPLTEVFLNHLLAALFIIGFWLSTIFLILKISISNTTYIEFLINSLPWRIISGILFYGIFILIYYTLIYNEKIKQKLIEEEQLKSSLKELELRTLKSQLNPHFLFNSLNSINALTLSKPEKAREMIVKLSEFLRYSLSKNKEQLITLNEEIENFDRYISIEQTRFGEKLKVNKQINETCLKEKVPALILQPMIENAIKYGVQLNNQPTHITLIIDKKPDHLILTLKNNKPQDVNTENIKGTGIGLKNIEERLQLIYKQPKLMYIENNEKMFTVTLLIPYKNEN
jgi:sensor histidine kinase YesM